MIIIICYISILPLQLLIMVSEMLHTKATLNDMVLSFLHEICQLRSSIKKLALIRVEASVKSLAKPN